MFIRPCYKKSNGKKTRLLSVGRIWCSDRGMTSEANINFLKQEGRKYIIGTAKGTLKKFKQELLAEDWNIVREPAR